MRIATLLLPFALFACDHDHAGDPDAAAIVGYDPHSVVVASSLAAPRSFKLHRSVIHFHSVYSWDACDEDGFEDPNGMQDYDAGTRNENCYDELRTGLCEDGYEVAFLTDHVDHFPDYEFPTVLLYDQSKGDQLIQKDGKPIAMNMMCSDGHTLVVQAGCDYDVLAIGLEQHVAATPALRRQVYGQKTNAAYTTYRANGGLALAGYLPRWTATDLLASQFDALENYNPIFNFQDRIGDAFQYLQAAISSPSTVPIPEIGLIAIFQENQTILGLWSQMVQSSHTPNFAGSNAHQNVFPQATADGERLDSYRRMLHWWSNYLMVPDGTTIDQDVAKAAIAAGHSFAAFDYLGYPSGFDYHAENAGTITEMGGTAAVGSNLVVVAPTVYGLAPTDAVPVIQVRIVKAEGTSWTEVMKGPGTLTVTAVPAGVYRAEASIVPNHLRPFMGSTPDTYSGEKLWIYGNPIWVQ